MDVSCDDNPSQIEQASPYFLNLSRAINRTGRPMDINACTGQGIYSAPELGPTFANSAVSPTLSFGRERFGSGLKPSVGVQRVGMDAYQGRLWRATIYNAATFAGYGRPGAWLDMDMVGGRPLNFSTPWYGQGGATLDLARLRSALSLRVIFASPLVVSAWLNATGSGGQAALVMGGRVI
jgi:hypothetical protein